MKEIDFENSVRHGDVMVLKFKDESFASGEHTDGVTLAKGEATGHHHTLYADGGFGKARMYFFDDKQILSVTDDMILTHQQHHSRSVKKGLYEVRIEKEYDWINDCLRSVRD